MRSFEFITEYNGKFDPSKPYEKHDVVAPVMTNQAINLATKINENCSEMLQAYRETGVLLLRGVRSDAEAITANIRPDRQPREMDPDAHELLHLAMTKMGLRATRTNSLFVTTNIGIADSWGHNVYAVFLKDGWSATVFTKIRNDYAFYKVQNLARSQKSMDALINGIKKLGPQEVSNSSQLAAILKKQYTDIIITGSSYIAIRVNTMEDLLTDVCQNLNIDPINT